MYAPPSCRARRMRADSAPDAGAMPAVQFGKSLSIFEIVSAARALNPDKVSQKLLFQAATPAPPQTGVTFFPPNNADPSIVVPAKAKPLRFTAAAIQLPVYFNWADSDNVAAAKKWGRRPDSMGKYTATVQNQLACGSCWAVSTATMFSDRWAIFTQGPNPELSATDILSCVRAGSDGHSFPFLNTAGCSGGIPAGAAELMARNGVVKNQCAPYTWCQENGVCNMSESSPDPESYLNMKIPACSASSSCLRCTGDRCTSKGEKPTVYKAKKYTSTQLDTSSLLQAQAAKGGISFTARIRNMDTSAAISVTTPRDIQEEIYINGPVIGAYAVFMDFQAGSSGGVIGDDWKATKGVYCNVQGRPKKPYSASRYAGMEAQLTGYHAVVIVGWGMERGIPDWENPGQTIDLPYWIVRNSWSEKWMANCMVGDGTGSGFRMPGHFKIAWTDYGRGINTQVYMDQAKEGVLGGTTAFMPDVVRAPPPGAKAEPLPSPEPSPSPEPAPPAPEPVVVSQYHVEGHGCVAGPAVGSADTYSSMAACEAANPDVLSADCVSAQNCVIRADGSGRFPTQADCMRQCVVQNLTYDSHVYSTPPYCSVNLNGTGKYKTEQECLDAAQHQYALNVGLGVGLGVGLPLIAAVIAVIVTQYQKKRGLR